MERMREKLENYANVIYEHSIIRGITNYANVNQVQLR